MLRHELKQLPCGLPELRKFGWSVGGVLLALGLWFWWRGKPWAPWLLAPGGALTLAGLIYPACLRKVYVGWMGLALVLGHVVSTVLLTIFFYLVITPVGLLARLLGKDFLRRRWQPEGATYWLERDPKTPPDRAGLERQF
jgi:hypothetical protein